MSQVFLALVHTTSFRRWSAGAVALGEAVPRAGCQYCCRSGSVYRVGRVLEVIRPVSLTLQETLDDPPCRVGVKFRFRIEPVDAGSLLRLDLRYRLDKAAQLRPAHWDQRLELHSRRLFKFVALNLEQQQTEAAADSKR